MRSAVEGRHGQKSLTVALIYVPYLFVTIAAEDNAGAEALNEIARTRAERQLGMLQELAEITMRAVRVVDDRLQQQGADLAALGQTLTKLSRAVRQTLALEAKLGEEQRSLDLRLHWARAKDREEAAAHRAARRKQAIRRVVEHLPIDADANEAFPADLFQDIPELSNLVPDHRSDH